MLKELHLQQVGLASHFNIEFADRLNIFTGDNGNGKSFLLDIAWWVLTTTWANQPAYPQQAKKENPRITGIVSSQKQTREFESYFDFSEQQWRHVHIPTLSEELVIYARADGGFCIYDPARIRDNAYNFNSDTLWNGLKLDGKVLCNGLIQDWVTWQNQPKKYPFTLFTNVIKKLAPSPSEWIQVGEPTRISIEDVRDIPTVNLPYGNVPVIYTLSLIHI